MRWPLLTFLALPLGYLAAWFFWGVPLPVMLLLLFGGAFIWMRLPGRASGWTFPRSLATVVLVGFIGWVVYWAFAGIVLISAPENPLPIGWPVLIILLLVGVAAIVASVYGLARLSKSAQQEQNTPQGRQTNLLAPWLWLAGVLAFAFFPAVRVDCRGLNADTYRTYQNGFLSADGGYWARHPTQIPNRDQIPSDFFAPFKPEAVTIAVARCAEDAKGRNRLFSLRASAPVIVVYLMDQRGPSRVYYAAAFTPQDHQKLTPWRAVPNPWTLWQSGMLYFNPAWQVDHVLPELPEPLRSALQD